MARFRATYLSYGKKRALLLEVLPDRGWTTERTQGLGLQTSMTQTDIFDLS